MKVKKVSNTIKDDSEQEESDTDTIGRTVDSGVKRTLSSEEAQCVRQVCLELNKRKK